MDTQGYQSIEETLTDVILLCERFCGLMDDNRSDAAGQVRQMLEILAQKEERSTLELPLPRLCSALGLRPFGWFCVVLALGCELDGGLRNRIRALTGSPVPTFDTAAGFYARYDGLTSTELIALTDPQASPLACALHLENRSKQLPAVFTPLVLRSGVLQYLVSGSLGAHAFYAKGVLPAELAPVQMELLEELQAAVRYAQKQSCYLLLSGREGSGKRTLVQRAVRILGADTLFLDCRTLGRLDSEALGVLAGDLTLDATLSWGVLCCTHYEPDCADRLERLLRDIPRQIVLVLLAADAAAALPLRGQPPLCFATGALSHDDYETAFRVFSGSQKSSDQPPVFYRLTVGEVKAALAQTKQLAGAAGMEPFGRLFARAVRLHSKPLALAQSIDPQDTLDDLIVDEEADRRLRMLCALLRANQNGAALGERRVKGVTALFYGSSGTGKTMAAGALAGELGLELLKIDLSRVMDKYIGETEKHLGELFAAARERNCILFFDEADALFGKRTEITSAHDRYANVETSFLLQSIENFDGAVILSTNLFKNFDKAFMRRIRLVVRFSMPDQRRRLILWQNALRGLPLAGDADLRELAEQGDCSPAMIAGVADTLRLLRQGATGKCAAEISAAELLALLEMEKSKQ